MFGAQIRCFQLNVPLLTLATQYAQELLQTFSTTIGEIALIPATGGIFTITMTHAVSNLTDTTASASPAHEAPPSIADTVIWDRKNDGGFPETKELKNRVRNIIEPDRNLGHIDRSLKKGSVQQAPPEMPSQAYSRPEADVKTEQKNSKDCEDCK